jgi:HSP20 family protein
MVSIAFLFWHGDCIVWIPSVETAIPRLAEWQPHSIRIFSQLKEKQVMSRFLNCGLSPESLVVMGRELDGMLEQLFGTQASQSGACKSGSCGTEPQKTYKAPAHIWEKDEQLFILLELPGVNKDDVSVTFENGNLEVQAEKKRPDLGEHKTWHNSIVEGVYKHRVAVGDSFNADSIEASMANGVLKISIRKKPETQPRKVEIQ